jgi:hypothetical protein
VTVAWLQEALSTVAGSTTSHADRFGQWAQAMAAAQGKRAAAGRGSASKRAEEMRDRIIAAAGAMASMPEHPTWVAVVGRRIAKHPAGYGFEAVPDNRTLRKAREHLLQKVCTTEPSCTQRRTDASQTVTLTT